MYRIPIPLALLMLSSIILIGIVFDAIGIAAAAADESPFNAMAAANVPGGRQALWITRNAGAVTSFCNDVVGDVAGTLSGALGAAIVYRLIMLRPTLEEGILSIFVVSLISALTVGGKATIKTWALEQSTSIVYTAGRILSVVERLGLIRLNVRQRNKKRSRNS